MIIAYRRVLALALISSVLVFGFVSIADAHVRTHPPRPTLEERLCKHVAALFKRFPVPPPLPVVCQKPNPTPTPSPSPTPWNAIP